MSHLRSKITGLSLLLLAALTPFIYFARFPEAYPYDIDAFLRWTACLKGYSNQPIEPCLPDSINYPTVGLYSSAGVLWALETLGSTSPNIRFHFQLFLAAVDILNLLVVYLLLRSLRIRFAAFATLFFAALPSTRLGASLWGQIDTISQLFLSLAFLFGLRGLGATERGIHQKALRYFGGLSLVAIFACLTKQLVAFSLPGIIALWTLLFAKLLSSPLRRSAVAILCVMPIFACWLDRLFPTPDGYLGSGLLYILSTGSSHGSEISANGTNLFSLLPVAGSSSSKESYYLFTLGGFDVSGVPFTIGIIGAVLLIVCGALIALRVAFKARPASARTTTLCLLGFTAFCNLALNVSLTGMHERYLYHYGFFACPVLLALITRSRAYWLLLLVVLAHLLTYGLFMLIRIDSRITQTAAFVIHHGIVFSNLFVLLLVMSLALWATRGERPPRQSSF